jgi:hypothetical protein
MLIKVLYFLEKAYFLFWRRWFDFHPL